MNKTEKYYVNLYDRILCRGDHKHYGVQYFYIKPSQTKIDIELSILRKMFQENGYNYRVLSGSCYVFTCAYLVNDENDHLWLKVFTKNKVCKILMED